jgi:hypothetical protein
VVTSKTVGSTIGLKLSAFIAEIGCGGAIVGEAAKPEIVFRALAGLLDGRKRRRRLLELPVALRDPASLKHDPQANL